MNILKITISLFIIYFLTACETTAVKNINNIQTENELSKNIPLPVDFNIAYHAEYEDLYQIQAVRWYNEIRYLFPGEGFREALEIVMPGHFKNAEQLKLGSNVNYVFSFKSEADTDLDGKYTVSLNTRVLNAKGEKRFETDTSGKSSGGIVFDKNAYMNAYAMALKEAIILFLNSFDGQNFTVGSNNQNSNDIIDSPEKVKKILGEIKPSKSGTGFYVNKSGNILTASHVINDCMFVEGQKNGQSFPTELIAQSKVIDLALLHTNEESPIFSSIGKSNGATLGMQIFVPGYPLSGILMDNPSLTQGSVSSLSGLKGSIGEFSFTAPVQPGNSGGPIVSFKGNVIGVVSRTLNQEEVKRRTGANSQNINFGIDVNLLTKFLDKNNAKYYLSDPRDFEQSSSSSIDYTTQILCYR